ncbi:MAG: hypothetical protein V4722_26915 [Bacteroidota bacterium]
MKNIDSLYIRLALMLMCLQASYFGNSQLTINKELEPLLANKTRFSDIMPVINRFYTSKNYNNDPKLRSKYKHWMRWAWYESRHLDKYGNFVNSNEKNYNTIQSLQQNNNTSTAPDGPQSISGNWSFYGPSIMPSGIARVDRLAFHPTDVNTIYAGTPAGGLWATYNGGTSWNALNGYIPNLGVSGIVVDADNPSTLYVLSGDGDSYANGGFIYTRRSIGLLKSTDGGTTWQKLSHIVPNNAIYYGFKLLQHPEFHNVFIACTSDGLYRSTDYGATWTMNINATCYDAEVTTGGYVYAAGTKSVFISTDWGNTFNLVPNSSFAQLPNNFTDHTALAIHPNFPNTLYVNFGGVFTNGQEHLLYRSNDKGATFTLVNNNCPPTSASLKALVINPSNVNNIVIGNVELRTSTNGGTTFNSGSPGIHADLHDLAYNPLNNILYAACDGGVYRSFDNGANWTALHNGIKATQYYHMTGYEGDDGLAMGGTQDNGMHSRSYSTTFDLAGGGDGFDVKYLNGNSNKAYYSINAGVFKFTRDINFTEQKLVLAGGINNQTNFFPSIAIHPTNNNIVYAGFPTGVYRTINDGVNWTNTGSSGSAGFGFSGGLAVSGNMPDRIYAARGSSLDISNDQGATWTQISLNPGWNPGGSISDITTRSNNANEVWVTFGGYGDVKVLYSSNAGASWVNMTGSLPDLPVYSIKYTSQGDAYIGTDAGVYFMDFSMSDWVPFSNGLPMVPVTEVFINETNNSIKAATFGRGMWTGNLYDACIPFLSLSGSLQGSYTWQSSSSIETTETMTGSVGNDIRYRSQKITLKPGYKALHGSYMHAIIGPCGQGVLNRSIAAAPKK